jgi:hypothetical protein
MTSFLAGETPGVTRMPRRCYHMHASFRTQAVLLVLLPGLSTSSGAFSTPRWLRHICTRRPHVPRSGQKTTRDARVVCISTRSPVAARFATCGLNVALFCSATWHGELLVAGGGLRPRSPTATQTAVR